MAKVIYGGGASDTLVVTTDKTQAYGLSDNDTIISGGNSSVLLIGGSGNDSLVMMGGIGTLNGGKGSDTFELNYSAVNGLSAVIEDYEAGDKIIINFVGDSAPQLSSSSLSNGDVVWRDPNGLFKLTLKSVRENDYFDGTGNAEDDNRLFEVLECTNTERENPTMPEAPKASDYSSESAYNTAYQKYLYEKPDQETLVATARTKELPWLTLSEGLMIGAASRAEEIAELDEQGKFEEYKHTRPEGKGDWDTVLEGKYIHPGENLQAGAESPANVTNAWIGSLSHHKNLLDERFTKLGVGYVYDNSYDQEHYWTQLFAGSLSSPSSISLDGLSIPQVHTISTAVTLDDNDNDYANTLNGATIAALDGNDKITNSGVFVSIAGGSGADTIDNRGSNVTICAGTGDDSINLSGVNNLIEYRAGDGNDTVSGFNETSKLKIIGDVEYMPVTVDNDVIVNVGGDSIMLKDAATLEGNDNYIIGGTLKKLFILTNKNDTKSYDIDGAIIEALGGNDKITNSGSNVSIDAGDDNDTVNNSGDFVTISAGEGNDTVNNSGDFVTISAGKDNDSLVNNGGASVLFVYDSGSDTISGFNETSTLRVSDGDYSSIAIGNDLILVGATDSIKVLNAAGLSTFNIVDANGEHVTVGDAKNRIGTEGNDAINNPINNATIQALGGDDTINNSGANVSIDAGAGDDSINNSGANVSIDAGAGNDTINNSGSNITIDSGEGNDSIDNKSSRVTINSGAGDDSISNSKANVTINAGDGNDYIANDSASVTIDAGAGDNTITSNGRKVSIVSGNGNDFINSSGDSVTVDGGSGDDTIHNSSNRVSIVSGDGNDSVNNEGSRVTIRTGAGDDTITNSGNAVAIHYGGGNDIVEGFNETSTLNLGSYAWQTVGSDAGVLVYVTSNDETIGTITLKDYSGEEVNIKSNWKPSSDKGTVIANYTSDTTVTGDDGDDTINNYSGSSVKILAGAGDDVIYNASLASAVTIDAGTGDDGILNGGENTSIFGGTGNDIINNLGSGVTINGSTDNDSITNAEKGSNVIINGGAGNDSIFNYSDSVTIDAGSGNDLIYNNSSLAVSVAIDSGMGDDAIYNSGSSVIINGGADNDTITNSGSQVTIDAGAGNDSIGNNGSNVSISTGADDDSVHNYSNSVTIDTGADDDFIDNEGGDSVTINSGTGNDRIWNNSGVNVSISSGDGNDYIWSGYVSSVTIDSGAGDDTVDNFCNNVSINTGSGNDSIVTSQHNGVTIEGGAGNDSIRNGDSSNANGGSNVSILGETGNDSIVNYKGDSVTIDGGAGNDYISNEFGKNVSIDGGAGDDSISSDGVNALISAGTGNDSILNYGANATIIAGDGNDSVVNQSNAYDSGSNVSITGGDGDDTIQNGYIGTDGSLHGGGANVSILGGTGNDQISLSADSKNNFVRYSLGDGNDTVWGINEDDTLNFLADESLVSSIHSGKNIIFNVVGSGKILLVDAWEKPPKITYGESGHSGGGSDNGGDNGGNSSGGNGSGGNGNNGSGKDNSSGGISTDANKGAGDASGNQSASGSAGRGSIGRGTSTGLGRGGGNNNSSDIISNTANSYNYYYDNKLSVTPFSSPFDALKTPAANQYVYTGNNMVIDTYKAGEKIFFLTDYTGSTFDGLGNLIVGSSTGALVVQNATDKFIDHYDAAGNSLLKAYAATTAGVIDGRWQAGFEVLNGSAGSDLIFAGDGGSQLLGGMDVVSDTLVGGNGTDTFVIGKTQGADIVLNASSADVVHLNDATLSDVFATAENDGAITVAFNTGNAIAVQSSEALSATFMLADGSAYRYNHAAKTWQSVNQNIYAGGNQIITDYQAGEKILFNATYTGATFDNAGNLIVGSSTGALAVTNATDKVINLSDATGNDFIKAYAATTAGVIDGRGLAGFEVINGSAGSDAVFAGNGGSQLWGGADNAADTLVGGNGSDIFIGGKAQGADIFINASSADVVHLSDVTLSDLIGSSEDNGTIAVVFNTGNVVTAQSSEALSAKFLMADGSAYRYNHANKSWQTA